MCSVYYPLRGASTKKIYNSVFVVGCDAFGSAMAFVNAIESSIPTMSSARDASHTCETVELTTNSVHRVNCSRHVLHLHH